MILKIQLIALLFSFLFGILFAVCVRINYKFLFHQKGVFQFLATFIFIIDMSLLYFFGLKIINHGILHPYFLIMVLLGFYLTYFFFQRIGKK